MVTRASLSRSCLYFSLCFFLFVIYLFFFIRILFLFWAPPFPPNVHVICPFDSRLEDGVRCDIAFVVEYALVTCRLTGDRAFDCGDVQKKKTTEKVTKKDIIGAFRCSVFI